MRSVGSFVVALLLLAAPACAQDKIVNIYNWSDYIDQKVLIEFTKETGIKVVYDTYDSNEALEAKVLAGRSGYDVVVPSATFLQRQIQTGAYQKLDKSKLLNLKNISSDISARMAVYDPGNQYAVNYMWFTTGIAYNTKKIKERLGDAIPNSWEHMFKPELLRKLSDCGIQVLDSPEDLFASALHFLKLPPDSKRESDIRRAADVLAGTKRFVRKFHSSEHINALANGDICMAVAWAGDAVQARNRARDAGNGIEINYVLPKEGTLINLDSFAIPKDAVHVEEAHKFIDFMLRPEIAARNSSVTNYANGVGASRALLPKDLSDNPSIYPDEATMKRLFTITTSDAAAQKLLVREWARIKTGR